MMKAFAAGFSLTMQALELAFSSGYMPALELGIPCYTGYFTFPAILAGANVKAGYQF